MKVEERFKKLPNVYFVGKAGSGKTYSANYLIENYGYIRAKFAFPVYNLAFDYFNMKGKNRELLQAIGTEVGRNMVDGNIWINRFKEDIFIIEHTYKSLYKMEVNLVADDVRFPNEHKLLQSMGWVGIYLDVPDDIRVKRLANRDGNAQVETLSHSSETIVDSFKDDLIKADASGTLEHMYQQIGDILEC